MIETENEKFLWSEDRIFHNLTFHFAAHEMQYCTRFIITRAALRGKEPPENFWNTPNRNEIVTVGPSDVK